MFRINKQIIAEVVGTFVLIYAGCGSALINKRGSGVLTLVGMSAVWGLVVTVMICTLGHVSGAHFNPAVTIALATSKKFPWKEVIRTEIFFYYCFFFFFFKKSCMSWSGPLIQVWVFELDSVMGRES